MRKKFLCLGLVLSLVIGMAVPAQAEEGTPTAIVTIGSVSTQYADFFEAWNAANGNEATLKLLKDVTLEANQTPLKLTSGAVTLEMADEKKLSGNANSNLSMLEVSEGAALILNSGAIQCQNETTIDVSGELTVNGGSIVCNSNSSYDPAAVKVSGGKFTLEDGLIDAYYSPFTDTCPYAVIAEGAELTIHGGTIRCQDNSGTSCFSARLKSNVTISGGLIQGKLGAFITDGTLNVSGGTIKGISYGLRIDNGCSARLSGGDFYGENSICNYNIGGMISDMLVAGYDFQRIDDNAWLVDTGEEIEGDVTVKEAPVKIEQEPQEQTIQYGDAFESLHIQASPLSEGASLEYQWYRIENDTELVIDGANGSDFSPSTGERFDVGGYQYFCKVACGDYVKRSSVVTLSVTQRELTPSVEGEIVKVYDENVEVPESLIPPITLAGVQEGDEVTASGWISYDSPDAGENKVVTVQFITLDGADVGKYTLSTNSFTTTGRIEKAPGVISYAPASARTTYTGEPQALVSPGTAIGGEPLVYAMREDGPYSPEPPTGVDAGDYTVWYKMAESQNYTGTSPESVTVRISPKHVIDLTVEVTPSSFVYDGSAKTPNVVVKDGDTVIPANEYTVEYEDNVYVGTASIIITNNEGGNYNVDGYETFSITACPVESVTLNQTDLKLAVGEEAVLVATVSPEIAENKNVSWTSSDPSVADVSEGVVTARNPGKATITVVTEDGGKTAEAKVTVAPEAAALIGLEVSGEAAALEGTPLDLSGLVVRAVYDDGKKETVLDYTVSGFNANQVGTQTVTVSYGGKSASLDVTVAAKSVTGIAIDALPKKISYTEGEPLDLSGLTIKAFYNNGKEEALQKGFAISGYNANAVGVQSVLVTYQGFTASFSVSVIGNSSGGVIAKPVIRIESVEGGKKVFLSASEGCEIHFTTDGSLPAIDSALYSEAFTVTDASTTIKAIAVSNGVKSPVTSGVIQVAKVCGVVPNPPGGEVQAGTVVTLRSETVGAEIYYTDSPDAAFSRETWEKYEGAIVVARTRSVRAVAVKKGFLDSDVIQLDYTVPETVGENAVVSLGSVTVAAGDVAPVPVYLFADSESTLFQQFRIALNFDANSFENVVSVTPAERIDPTKLFVSSAGGVLNLLYQGEPIASGEICTLNFATLASSPEGSALEVKVDLKNCSIVSDAPGGGTSSVDAVVSLTAARLNRLEGAGFSFTDADTGRALDSFDSSVSEFEVNMTVDSASVNDLRETFANVYLAVFDRNGRLANVRSWKVDLADPSLAFIQSIRVPEGVEVGEIKIMVLSDRMVPLMAASELK